MLGVAPEEIYQLRKMQMDTEKKALELQKSQQDLDRFVSDREHKHGLIAEGRSLDIKTESIKEPIPTPNHNGNGNGKGHTKELLSTATE